MGVVVGVGGLGRGQAHFGPDLTGFLPAQQSPVAHFGPNYTHKIGPGQKPEARWAKMGHMNIP